MFVTELIVVRVVINIFPWHVTNNASASDRKCDYVEFILFSKFLFLL